MREVFTPARAALGGTAVIMACACGAASSSATLLAAAGIPASTRTVHPVFIGVAAGLMIAGLWRVARASGYLAVAGFATLALAALLTPPTVMTTKALPWNPAQISGGILYLVAAGFVGYAFWRAFPTPQPGSSVLAVGGAALATGCTCCMVTGAVAGLATTAGASASIVESTSLLYWSGLAAATLGLFRLGGLAAAWLVPAGGLIARYGPELLKVAGDWTVAGANLRFVPSYLIAVAGSGVIMYGFGRAYRAARSRAGAPPWRALVRQPALRGAPGS